MVRAALKYARTEVSCRKAVLGRKERAVIIRHGRIENSPFRVAHEVDEDGNAIRLLGIIAQAKAFLERGYVHPICDDDEKYRDNWLMIMPDSDELGEFESLHEARIALEDHYAPPVDSELEKYCYEISYPPNEN